jgi:hypothetical protein
MTVGQRLRRCPDLRANQSIEDFGLGGPGRSSLSGPVLVEHERDLDLWQLTNYAWCELSIVGKIKNGLWNMRRRLCNCRWLLGSLSNSTLDSYLDDYY